MKFIFIDYLVRSDFDVQILSAINDARVHQRGGFRPSGRGWFHVRFLRHERSLGKRRGKKSILARDSSVSAKAATPFSSLDRKKRKST